MPKYEPKIINHGEANMDLLCKEEISAFYSALLTQMLKLKNEKPQDEEEQADG